MRTVVLLALMLVGGCGQPLSPQDVSDRFWRAVMTREPAKIRRYVQAADRDALSSDTDILPVSAYELGRTVIDAENAEIDTRVTLSGDQPLTVDIKTVLIEETGQWKIDYQATIANISMRSELAQVIDQIEDFGEMLKDGIDKSIDDFKDVLPDIERELSRIESEIKQQVPALRKRLEEFSKRLEESLRGHDGDAETGPPPAISI